MRSLLLLIAIISSCASIAQNVGIGTSTPAFKLDVNTGSINTDSLYRINSSQVLSIRGDRNLFIGRDAGINNNGVDNTFAGDSAGLGNTTGSRNSFFGHRSGTRNITGEENTAVGGRTLTNNIDGRQNTAIGHLALFQNSSGIGSTAIGAQALLNNTADYNTGVGLTALSSNSSGTQNTSIGALSLGSNSTASFNTALGYGTLVSSNGDYNTAVGHLAFIQNTSGTRNTALGYNTAVAVGNLTNATAIGSQALVATSNTVVLGSIAGLNGATNSVRVGIGTASPGFTLDIASSAQVPVGFRGSTNMYMPFYEDGNYRGYLGSFAGSPEDIDFGTGSVNSTGSVHFTLSGSPRVTIEHTTGNVNIRDGELNRSTRTGTANLVPIAYGYVNAAGGIGASGTGNFTVERSSVGVYNITIDSENFVITGYAAIATPIYAVAPVIATSGSSSNRLVIRTFNVAGAFIDNAFNFVVYRQ